MNLSKHDLRNIIKISKMLNEDEIKNLINNSNNLNNSDIKRTIVKLKKYKEPINFFKKYVDKYILSKKGGSTFIIGNNDLDVNNTIHLNQYNNQQSNDVYQIPPIDVDKIPPFTYEGNKILLSNLEGKIKEFLNKENGKTLTEILKNFNNEKSLLHLLKYIIAYNIGNIEAEIGIHGNIFLNFIVKILDDFSRSSNELIESNVYIIIYIIYKFFTSNYDHNIYGIVSNLKLNIYNYINLNLDYLANLIDNEYTIYVNNDEKLDFKMISRNNKFDDFFLDNLMNLIFIRLEKKLILSLLEFLEIYEFLDKVVRHRDKLKLLLDE